MDLDRKPSWSSRPPSEPAALCPLRSGEVSMRSQSRHSNRTAAAAHSRPVSQLSMQSVCKRRKQAGSRVRCVSPRALSKGGDALSLSEGIGAIARQGHSSSSGCCVPKRADQKQSNFPLSSCGAAFCRARPCLALTHYRE